MLERGISRHDVSAVVAGGTPVEVDSERQPFPVVLWFATINRRPIHAVAGYDIKHVFAYVITAYVPDRNHFEDEMMTRKP